MIMDESEQLKLLADRMVKSLPPISYAQGFNLGVIVRDALKRAWRQGFTAGYAKAKGIKRNNGSRICDAL